MGRGQTILMKSLTTFLITKTRLKTISGATHRLTTITIITTIFSRITILIFLKVHC